MRVEHKPEDACATWHEQLLAGIVASYHNCVYIEIGILHGNCYRPAAAQAKEAHAVDPGDFAMNGGGIGTFWHMTSDLFFEKYDGSPPDVVFIDGEHSQNQAQLDYDNAIKILAPGGTIVFHDTQPIMNNFGRREDLSGNVWLTRKNLENDPTIEMFTFQRFPGVTLVRRLDDAPSEDVETIHPGWHTG